MPVPELRELRIAQATRGYTPMEISHYQASWVSGERFPYPQWPRPLPPNGTLLGPAEAGGLVPLVIDGPFAAATELRLHVLTVSGLAQLVVEADGKPVFQKQFQCGPGKGEWKKAEFKPQWQIYQNLFDRDYTAKIPAGTPAGPDPRGRRRLAANRPDRPEAGRRGAKETRSTSCRISARGRSPSAMPPARPAVRSSGCRCRTGLAVEDLHRALEGGGSRRASASWWANGASSTSTPHDVVLRWAEDCLGNWQKAGWGWAMWNFRGSFGVLDSGRSDVKYEDFEGHKLDRKLMDLLQRY